MRIVLRGFLPGFFLLFIAIPALAQSERQRSDEIQQLDKKLEHLAAEIETFRRQLEELRGAPAEEDLTAVEPVETQAAPEPQQPPAQEQQPEEPALLDAQLVPNVISAGASKIFNPDISAIGTFVGFAGTNPAEDEPSASLEEGEFTFDTFVDPYAKAFFFIGVTEEGAEIEEGYVNFIALPRDFIAKVGKMRTNFGKVNLLHTHQRAWIDVPLVIDTFFGEEGLADSGISLSKLFPNPFNVFLEATGEIFSGNAEGVFEAEGKNDLFYLGHFKVYRDITENSNVEFGTSYARGTLPEFGGTNQFGGLDLTFRYKPLERAIYRSFIGRTELIWNDRDDQSERAFGFYTSADYQLARRWFAGIRLDQVDHPDDPAFTDRSASLTLTFWPSEWSQLRGQFRHINFDQSEDASELLLQVQFSIGAHGAHTF